jgi:hypothetical protein
MKPSAFSGVCVLGVDSSLISTLGVVCTCHSCMAHTVHLVVVQRADTCYRFLHFVFILLASKQSFKLYINEGAAVVKTCFCGISYDFLKSA